MIALSNLTAEHRQRTGRWLVLHTSDAAVAGVRQEEVVARIEGDAVDEREFRVDRSSSIATLAVRAGTSDGREGAGAVYPRNAGVLRVRYIEAPRRVNRDEERGIERCSRRRTTVTPESRRAV